MDRFRPALKLNVSSEVQTLKRHVEEYCALKIRLPLFSQYFYTGSRTIRGRDSSVGTVGRLRAARQQNHGSIPSNSIRSSSLPEHPNGLSDPPSRVFKVYRKLFARG